MMRRIAGVLVSLLVVCCLGGCRVNRMGNIGEINDTPYDIEQVVHDNVFSDIIAGKLVPVEFKYGIGGADGYKQYSTKDSEMINAYIDALKEIKIKEVITTKEDWIIIFDGIQDYIFVMEDGTEVVIGTDLSTYVRDSEVEYVLEYNKGLSVLNKMICE